MAELEIETIIERYNPWWSQKFNAKGIIRKNYIEKLKRSLINNQIMLITGLRRVGKTTIIKQFIEFLIESEKINPKTILFVSLDDPSFVKISLQDIIEKFRKINLLNFETKIFLFFDEISYKDNFSMELKSINNNQNVKTFASGSNSLKVMDKKAFLTGRTFTIKIYPLDFQEYLIFKDLELLKEDKHLEEKYFEDYLKEGGMPEYVLTKDPQFIKTIIEDIIYKDIARTHGIKNISKLKELFLLLCERTGKKISYNKLSSILGIDKESVSEYISYFCQTFLFSVIPRYSKSLNERIYSNKKAYISDNGIRNIFVGFKDKGSLFENYVFNELSKKFDSIFYYYENEKEVDFIARVNLKKEIAIESKYLIVNKTDKEQFERIKFRDKYIVKNHEELKEMIQNISLS